jgi:C_GCAxxG_C_C family probable redox protein
MAELSQEEKNEILDRVQQKATSYQFEYRGCGQTPLQALIEEFNLSDDPGGFKAANFFGYGIIREMDVCGALLGAMMAIGMAAGRSSFDEPLYPDAKDIDPATGLTRSAGKIRELYEKFVEKYGGTTCRALQENNFEKVYELADPKQSNIFSEMHGEDCAEVVGQVARWAAEVILELPRR